MLNFNHFESEYTRTSRLLGIRVDPEVVGLYYDTVKNFTNPELTEAFFEARVTMEKFPKPAELRAIRNLIQSRTAKPALPFAEVPVSSCPQHLKEMMAAVERCRSRFPKFLSRDQHEILDKEREFIFGPKSPYRPGAIVEAEFVSVVEF